MTTRLERGKKGLYFDLESRKEEAICYSGSFIKKKGLGHVDFVIAAGIFLVVFVIVVQTVTSFFTEAESTTAINTLTGEAFSLLSLADYGFEPKNWTGNGSVERIGLSTTAYRFVVVVNNTKTYLINQSQNVTALTDELVSFNYTDIGFSGADRNSTAIYDENSNRVPYNISGPIITFRASASVNETRFFTVYFDDDSNFTNSSASVTGTNTINETLYPVYAIRVLQYSKTLVLNGSNYTSVRSALNSSDFRISVSDTATGGEFFSYGGDIPRRGNVVAMQRYTVFQNSTAGVRSGKIIVQVW